MTLLYIVIRECQGSVLLSFLIILVLFIALDIFSLIWQIKLRLSFKNISKCFCQLAQSTGALSKRFLDELIWLVSLKISLPEHVFNQDWKTISTYKPTQIFFAAFISLFAEMLQSFTTGNIDVSSAKSFTVQSKLSDKSLI